MSLFKALGTLINGSVGKGYENNEDDVQEVARALKQLNSYNRDDDRFMNSGLDGAIKKFQTHNGLKIDGILHPGGETERQIIGLRSPQRLSGLRALQAGVGSGQENREDDVQEIERGLGSLSYLPAVHRIQPRGFMTAGIESGMRKFQGDRDLKQDGYALPGGETWGELRRLVSSEKVKEKRFFQDMQDEDLRAFLTKSENDIPHLYKDSKGYVTVGIGKNLEGYPLQKLKMYMLDKKRNPIRQIDDLEREHEFERVKRLSKSMYANTYKKMIGDYYIGITRDDAVKILNDDIESSLQELNERHFPGKFKTFPKSARMALLDMQFNMGGNNFQRKKWPDLFSAIDKGDWKTAATESHRVDVSEDRNEEIYDLFIEAGRR